MGDWALGCECWLQLRLKVKAQRQDSRGGGDRGACSPAVGDQLARGPSVAQCRPVAVGGACVVDGLGIWSTPCRIGPSAPLERATPELWVFGRPVACCSDALGDSSTLLLLLCPVAQQHFVKLPFSVHTPIPDLSLLFPNPPACCCRPARRRILPIHPSIPPRDFLVAPFN